MKLVDTGLGCHNVNKFLYDKSIPDGDLLMVTIKCNAFFYKPIERCDFWKLKEKYYLCKDYLIAYAKTLYHSRM